MLSAAIVLPSTLVASLACAQSSEPSAHTVAVDMFDAGDALMASGKIHDACPKYAESYRLDPRLGALLHWADCLEQDGKLASAYAAFRDAVELAERSGDRRSEFAAARVRSLEPLLSRIVIEAPKEGLPPDATIQLDSLSIVASGLGVGIAVDPGEHSVRASAPGFVPFTSSVTLGGAGQVQRITIPTLERLTPIAPAPVEPAHATAVVNTDALLAPKPASTPARNEQKWLGVGVGGAGVAALGVGAYFFSRMLGKLDQRDELCPRETCPTNTDRDRVRSLESDARSAEAWALGLSIGGAIAVVAGTVLYLRSPSDTAALSAWQPRVAQAGVTHGLEWHF